MENSPSSDKVTIELDRDLAISLFEWAYQFMVDQNPQFQHPSDAIGVDQLSGQLERALTEPFQESYPMVLDLARERALAKYIGHMGEQHSEWLRKLEYQGSK
jgi:hypothetical protein